MVQGVMARVQHVPGPAERPVAEHLDAVREVALELARHDKVREAVEDDADAHALGGLTSEMVLEAPADGIALPDEGVHEHRLAGAVDGGDHVVVEVLAVAIELEGVALDGDLRRLQIGEAALGAPPLALGGQGGEHSQHDGLHGEERGEESRAPGARDGAASAGAAPAARGRGRSAGGRAVVWCLWYGPRLAGILWSPCVAPHVVLATAGWRSPSPRPRGRTTVRPYARSGGGAAAGVPPTGVPALATVPCQATRQATESAQTGPFVGRTPSLLGSSTV